MTSKVLSFLPEFSENSCNRVRNPAYRHRERQKGKPEASDYLVALLRY